MGEAVDRLAHVGGATSQTRVCEPRRFLSAAPVSRRIFSSAPWKRAKMKRSEFEALLLEMPNGVREYVFKRAAAERLVDAVFGKSSQE